MPRLFRSLARLGACALVLGLAAHGASAQTTTRHALVIGNAGYAQAPLDTPIDDARLVARVLAELGFEVDLRLDVSDADLPDIRAVIEGPLAAADVGLFYFAGHGLRYGGENMMVTVATDLTDGDDIRDKSIALSALLDRLTQSGGGLKIVVLDSCRNEVLPGADASLSTGFSLEEAPRGEVLVAFSTAAGDVALDSVGGRNSPYTAALANALQLGGADVYDVFRAIRRDVRSSTGGRQVPWLTGSIETEFVFRAAAAAPAAPDPAAAARPGSFVTPAGARITLDAILWSFLENSLDGRDLRMFASAFPESRHAARAAERLREIDLSGPDSDATARGLDMVTPEEAAAQQSRVLDMAGTYVLREAFRIWPERLPDVEKGLGRVFTACDALAADPVDPQKVSPGISAPTMDARQALRACGFDLARDPNNPRLLFQFARVLGVLGRHDWSNAIYDRAAALGYEAALVNRGYNARIGRGQERDLELAFDLTLRAAEMGNPRARTNIGAAFINGRGVDKDPGEGILWVRLAASMGWPHATNLLGDNYRLGRGVAVDLDEAFSLYRAAASQGQTTAMANLGLAYVRGEGTEPDEAEGIAWLNRAAQLGNRFAPLYLGDIYLDGAGSIAADPVLARALYRTAAERGAGRAYARLAEGHLAGRFGAGPDPAAAYRNALFAQAARQLGGSDVLDRAAAALSPETRAGIEADVARFLKLNGL
ncbi:peptidase [Rhodobacteraceae bacterium CCMM004]|nr:peptidase [Rhodobacteraceae bacterium CCMM004]